MSFIETGNFRGGLEKISSEVNSDDTKSPRYGFSDSATSLIQSLLTALQDIAPVSEHVPVTPSDSTVLTGVRGLKIGGDGDIAVRVNGVDQTYAVTAGEYLPLKAQRVLSTGTTATGIVAWK